MRVGDVVAEIMKRERVNVLFVYPLTPLTEYAAAADIRPIVVRQERVACAMADAGGRLSSSDDVKVFACQGGPGIENSFGAVAQAYSEGVPLVVIVPGPSRALANVPPDLQRHVELQAHHQERRDGDHAGDDRPGAAPRVHARAQRPPRSMPGRGVRRVRRRDSVDRDAGRPRV